MSDPTSLANSEDPSAALKSMYGEQQALDVQRMRDSGNEAGANRAEIVNNIEEKTLYRDVKTGAEVTIIDGDALSVKPYLETSHQQMLENSGGAEELISQTTENLQSQVDAGDMTQAAMDKNIEILNESGDNSAKFSELKFGSNDFFAEQAKISGVDPAAANDITLISNEIVTTLTSSVDADGNETEIDKVVSGSELTPDNLDMSTLVVVAQGNDLTTAGKLFIVDDAISGVSGISMGDSFFEDMKTNFNDMMSKHGSVEAFADSIEQDMDQFMDSNNMSQQSKENVIEAVKNSDGDANRFVASLVNSNQDLAANNPENIANAAMQNNVVQEKEHQERQALNLQNLLGGDVQAGGIKSLFDPNGPMMQIFVGLIAAFTGQDPKEIMAKLQEGIEKNKAEADKKNQDVASKNEGEDPKKETPKSDDPKVAQSESPKEDKPPTEVIADKTPEAAPPEEDKNYVQGNVPGPVTFDVATLSQGEPIANFDVGSMIFSGGGDAPSLFNNVSNPDVSQISMVDPMLDMSATADTVEPPKNENVIGSMNI